MQRKESSYDKAFSHVKILQNHDAKTAFLNWEYEDIYMVWPKGFIMEGKEHMRCHLKKSIYRLRYTAEQWYVWLNENKEKFWVVLSKGQDDKLCICKV